MKQLNKQRLGKQPSKKKITPAAVTKNDTFLTHRTMESVTSKEHSPARVKKQPQPSMSNSVKKMRKAANERPPRYAPTSLEQAQALIAEAMPHIEN